MIPKVIADLRQAIEEQDGTPASVVDAATNARYVLLRAEQYEQVKALVGEEADLDPRAMYPVVDRVFEEDWDDPAMDVYDDDDAHCKLV